MKDNIEVNVDENLDIEWVELMLMARDIGIAPDEIRIFLAQTSVSEE